MKKLLAQSVFSLGEQTYAPSQQLTADDKTADKLSAIGYATIMGEAHSDEAADMLDVGKMLKKPKQTMTSRNKNPRKKRQGRADEQKNNGG